MVWGAPLGIFTMHEDPPPDCLDPYWWEVEQQAARTLARRPELELGAGERFAGRTHRGYDYPVDADRYRMLFDFGRVCGRCEGHGHYNLRRSFLCGWHWAVCWACAGYGYLPPEVEG